jgi:hypothetical protein
MVNYKDQVDIDIRELWKVNCRDTPALPDRGSRTINLDFEEVKQFKALFQEK